jgi:hypothetical protein
MNEQLKQPIHQVITLLVAGKYTELEALTHGVRLSAKEIENAISDYGKKLVLLPENSFGLMDVVEVKDAIPKRWSIAMPLWTQEEGRSDLTLEITAIKQQNGFEVELDDIHVL